MGRSRLLRRNPSLCVLPCEREEYGAMSHPVGREQQERPQLRRRLAGRSTVTITILYGKRAAGRGSSLREAVRARAGRGRKRARAGSAVTLRAKPRAGRERSRRDRPGLLSCPRSPCECHTPVAWQATGGGFPAGKGLRINRRLLPIFVAHPTTGGG